MEISIITNDENGGVSRTTRAREPAHHILKIESFSLLSRAGIREFESDVLQAGGYKWKLRLYPNGNEEEDGKNHISLYLVLADTTGLPTGWNIHVCLEFFIYDHIRNNYLSIQAADGMATNFNAITTKSGFSKLLSLDCFKDSSNGYLYNDSCVFGAEVFIIPRCAETETCLSMIEPPSWNNTYTWVIEKFLTIKGVQLYSEVFKIGKINWYGPMGKLSVYPKGNVMASPEQLSMFLKVSDCSSFPLGWRFYLKYKLRVKDQVGHNHIEKDGAAWFCDSGTDWGFTKFMLLSEIKEGLLLNGNLIIEAEILALGTVKKSL